MEIASPTNTASPTNGKRHHRTATPEQRQIRATMQAPVYTFGIEPQTDRSLLCDFFDAIKTWATAYTIDLRTLAAAQTHTLAAHPVLTSLAIPPTQLDALVPEKDKLPSLIAAFVTRFISMRTIDAHALTLSGHPRAQLIEALEHDWARLLTDEHEAKHDLLQRQRAIYTAIKNDPDHRVWRASCAQYFTNDLMNVLADLLIPLYPAAAKNCVHVMQELFVKGYRIGFRLHMSAVRWDFMWPVSGQGFDARVMVNESRMLYGDVLRTMEEVGRREEEHEVRFARSPVVWKREWGVGGEMGEVVYSACVEVGRREM
jgi:hypothetical protein